MVLKPLKHCKRVLESRKCEGHKFLSGFNKFKSSVTSVKNAEHFGFPSVGKTDENMDQVKNFSTETVITVHKVANMLGILFG
jgi:imidazoleglycerol phosphate synthase glutamine amidotransferase subunit HisH